MKALAAGALVALAGRTVCGATQDYRDFARYEVILKRQPFGEVTEPEPAPSPPPPPSQVPMLQKPYKMCAITEENEEGGAVRVGIVNLSVKPPRNYYLRIGEIEDGVELLDADYESETALVKVSGEEFEISMNEQIILAAATAPGTSPAGQPAASRPATARESYVERLRKRREEVRRRNVEPPKVEDKKLEGKELEEHLRQLQMDLIRARGEKGPPLPIPLTPEMDAQLVAEGVLPPLEEAETE